MTDFSAGPLTRRLWDDTRDVTSRIEALPFLRELAAGRLDPKAFVTYIVQDSLYLSSYGRVMAMLAAKAGKREEVHFWAHSVIRAIAGEEMVHAQLLADPALATARHALALQVAEPKASPTTLGYMSFLQATAVMESYKVGVAGVLPCFWVYAHVGAGLARRHGELPPEHPYKMWMATYGDPAFAEVTHQAVAILETCLADAGAAERVKMREVFRQACVYEWHFWQAAHVMQDWMVNQEMAVQAP